MLMKNCTFASFSYLFFPAYPFFFGHLGVDGFTILLYSNGATLFSIDLVVLILSVANCEKCELW